MAPSAIAFQTSDFIRASSAVFGGRSSDPITALRTVLWPIERREIDGRGMFAQRASAAATSSAEVPQLPATTVVTPMRTKLDAAGRSARSSA